MYIINPTSGKEIPNSYPTSSSTGSNSSSGSTTSSHHQQEIISKILTKCATMTDEVSGSATTTTTVNGTATILLSPASAAAAAAAVGHHHLVGVSPQSSPASSSSSASSPTADGPQPPPPASSKAKGPPPPGSSSNGKHTGNGSSKLNGNGTQSLAVSGGGIGSGGRLQFFKDGKFILELARAREGEKTGWISVSRKTYYPPTVSSISANFHKHESSTSLSFSDDNSSIQSSPWQRDHCWKQTNPRPNISREMSLYYHRPSCVRFKLPRELVKRLRLKRRRPYEQAVPLPPLHYEITSRDDGKDDGGASEDDAMDLKVNGSTSSPEPSTKTNGVENGSAAPKDFKIRKRRGQLQRRRELASIVQQLTVRVANAVNSTPARPAPGGLRSVFSSSHQQHVSPRKRILRELEKVSLEDSSTMKRSRPKPGSNSTVITATTATPLASASAAAVTSNGSSNSSSSTNGKLTNGTAPPVIPPTTPVSRPISSYSITSLLGHNSSGESSSSSSRSKQETNSTTSHHPYQQQQQQHHHQPSYQYLGKDAITSPKSPSDAHLSQRYYGKKKSPSYGGTASPSSAGTEYGAGYGMIRSPDLSPSPEHQSHSFTRYRQHPYSIHPTVSSPSSSYSTVSRCSPSPSTNDSASSPYSGGNAAKYRPAYLASSGSPPSSANPAGSANSPQHYSRQSPLNFARSPPPSHQPSYPPPTGSSSFRNSKEPSSSPRASPSVADPVRVPATTPTSSSTTPSIRTVPKKTAALRQQFGSPSPSSPSIDPVKRERSNSNASSTSSSEVNRSGGAHLKKELDYAERSAAVDMVDGIHHQHPAASQASPVIRPSTVIASPTPHHPVPNPFYMYPPQIAASLLAAQQSSAVPFLSASPITSYYQHMYNQASVAAAYRNQVWMHYQGLGPHAAAAAAAAAAAVSPPTAVPPPPLASSAAAAAGSGSRDAQRDSSRIHSATAATTAASSSSNSSSSPSPAAAAAAALNYSAAALASSSSSHHNHHPPPHLHPGLASHWGAPSSGRRTPPPPAAATAAAKEDIGADVPLNLSKH